MEAEEKATFSGGGVASGLTGEGAGEEEEEESRDLTHDEIWDDSALIEAWNSATAEYEVCGRNMKIMVSDGAS